MLSSLPAKNKGATILEVLAAVGIFSIAILVLFGSFSLALRFTQQAKNVSVATNSAQKIIEQLRLDGFDSAIINSTPTAVSVADLPGGQSKTFVSYYQENTKIKEVTVKVYWDGRPESNAITLITLIGQGGIGG